MTGYTIDSGGQIEFLEALPAFIQHTSVCLFVTNLSEKLSECPKSEYFEDGKPVGEPTLCPFMHRCSCIVCRQSRLSAPFKMAVQTRAQSIHSTNQGSKLVILGTHGDLEDQCSECREEKK